MDRVCSFSSPASVCFGSPGFCPGSLPGYLVVSCCDGCSHRCCHLGGCYQCSFQLLLSAVGHVSLSLSQPSVKPAVLPLLRPGLLDHQCSLYLRCQAGGCSTATGLLSALLLLLLHCRLIFHAWPSSVMALIQTCWSEKALPQPIFAMLRNATQEDTSQSE